MRIRKEKDFELIFAKGKSSRLSDMTFIILQNSFGHPRLGISIGRKYGNAAARNRFKRKMREAFRLSQHELPAIDIMCIPKPAAKNLSMQRLQDILKANLL